MKVAVVVSLTAGAAAWMNSLVAPIQKQIEFLQAELNKNDEQDNKSIDDRIQLHALLAGIEKQFAEIETQFRNLDERTKKMDEASAREFGELDTRLQREIQAQAARIDALGVFLPRRDK